MNILQRIFYYFLGLVIVGLFLFIVFNFFVMPWVVRKGQEVVVPSVVGLNVDSAAAILQKEGLIPVVDTLIPSADVPAGAVLEQDPASDYEVKKGRRVFLKVSAGITLVQVPDLIGKPRDEAESILKDLGFEVKVEYVESEEYESDIVLDMSPPPGKEIPKGSVVILYVSKEVL